MLASLAVLIAKRPLKFVKRLAGAAFELSMHTHDDSNAVNGPDQCMVLPLDFS